ncbi:MAG TPA: hypothetical protein VN657_12820 [Nitrospiraceae bacterium]|jgi:hypothetical protein|nr:hypothetical protein [Nitrospiraceae bacterium]
MIIPFASGEYVFSTVAVSPALWLRSFCNMLSVDEDIGNKTLVDVLAV